MAVQPPAATTIPPPNPPTLLTPLLPALTAAAASTVPADAILPLLSPILRQRVQFLSASSSDPWLRLLCYDSSKARALSDIATSGSLEPHPVSGEVEIDWDYDAQTRYRRVDSETLQALVVLGELGLGFQLVWCVGDPDGGDGWRIGEVTVADKEPFAAFGGQPTMAQAEKDFEAKKGAKTQTNGGHLAVNGTKPVEEVQEEDDDDDYWAQYDATPGRGRTPAQKASPAPRSIAGGQPPTKTEEDNYFAQYDDVQPAMDNHDPDEEAAAAQLSPQQPPLGLGAGAGSNPQAPKFDEAILHPRPESSASSNGEDTVAKLEAEAGKLEDKAGRQEQNEFGVRQHVSRSIRSLFMLSRASGIEREEFERLVKRELDVLGMMEESE